MKNWFVNLTTAVFAAFLLAACGGDSGSTNSTPKISDADYEADSYKGLPKCSDELDGKTAYVVDQEQGYVCEKGEWVEDEAAVEIKSSSSSSGSNVSIDIHAEENNSASYVPEKNVPIKNKTITGFAQKGPFKAGSVVDIFELELDGKTFAQTGKSFTGKVSNDSGAFKISNVSLKSQYALLRVTGSFKSEINDESVHATLTAVTDLSKRENVNVNILTHLEYDRVLYLLNKGMNFTSAKKQAEREVLAAFGFEGTFKNVEELNVFGNGDDDAVLVAISKLVLADTNGLNRDEESLSGLLTEISMDLEEDGKISGSGYESFPIASSWNGKGNIGQTLGYGGNDEKCSIWELNSNAERIIHRYVISYNVGEFCTSAIEGKILAAHYCDRYDKYGEGFDCHTKKFVCMDGEWWYVKSNENGWCQEFIELKLAQWKNGKDGEVRKLDDVERFYKYDEEHISKDCKEKYEFFFDWSSLKCGQKKGGWREISNLDTMLTVCTTKHIGKIAGPVIKSHMFNPVTGITEEMGVDSLFYYCDKDGWRKATDAERNTEGVKCSKKGSVVRGKINGDIYYYCDENGWREATDIEKNTYGLVCSKDGIVVQGVINEEKKYVCDADTFRIVNAQDTLYDFACVSYTEGKIDENMECKKGKFIWNGTYGTLKDGRDGKTYKTLPIGDVVWMAENLNFEYRIYSAEAVDSVSYGNYCNTDSCKTYGRYYTWAAAMDSAGVYSTNGEGCGYEKVCSPKYPVQGICPVGWHLPTIDEWESFEYFYSKDSYVLPAGEYFNDEFDYVGLRAYIWSSSDLGSSEDAWYWEIDEENITDLFYVRKWAGLSVRCVKDGP